MTWRHILFISRSSHSPESGVGSHTSHTSLPDSEVERLYANAEAEIGADEDETLNGESFDSELLPVLGTCRALYAFEGINIVDLLVITLFVLSSGPALGMRLIWSHAFVNQQHQQPRGGGGTEISRLLYVQCRLEMRVMFESDRLTYPVLDRWMFLNWAKFKLLLLMMISS